jgi:hypothetical protein
LASRFRFLMLVLEGLIHDGNVKNSLNSQHKISIRRSNFGDHNCKRGKVRMLIETSFGDILS